LRLPPFGAGVRATSSGSASATGAVVDHSIGLVRKLNQHALAEDTAVVEEIGVEMLAAVDRITAAAAVSEAIEPESPARVQRPAAPA
jgi:hypothetical protein